MIVTYTHDLFISEILRLTPETDEDRVVLMLMDGRYLLSSRNDRGCPGKDATLSLYLRRGNIETQRLPDVLSPGY
jgi:hypothetical protein